MANDDDSVRLGEKRPADSTTISPEQLPLKKRNYPKPPVSDDSQFKRPTSRSGIDVVTRSLQQLDISEPVSESDTPPVDIYEYLHQLEGEARRRPRPDYIEKLQKEITSDVRAIFVDWVVKVAEKCKLRSDLLHQTVSYIDRYLSVNTFERKRLKILGLSSMLISLKYEYKDHPSATDLCNTSGATCTNLDVVKMEYEILKALEFEMGNPTTKTFLRKFTRVAQEEDKIYNLQLEVLADYLAELSLLEYKCLKFLPSMVAASVVFLSRFIIRSELRPWSSALQQESGYAPENLKECVRLIHDWQTSREGGGILNAVRNKYKQHELVSKLSSPATIPAFFFGDTTSMVDEEDEEDEHLADKETAGVDVFEYLRQIELFVRPSPEYMEKVQTEFTSDFRAIFVDWVIKVAEKCKLRSDILHQTVSYIDRYLSVNAVDRQRLQLLGVSAMLISLKYEYKGHASATDLCKITGAKCTNLEVVKMEAKILDSLEFKIGNPTVKTFLGKFTKVAQEEGDEYDLLLDFLCDYLAELSLLEYKCLKFVPSLVAASVVFLSRFTIKAESNPWSTALQKESEYEAYNLEECVLLIHDWQAGRKDGGILNAVKNKYKQHEFKCVSKLIPPDTIPASYFQEVEDESQYFDRFLVDRNDDIEALFV